MTRFGSACPEGARAWTGRTLRIASVVVLVAVAWFGPSPRSPARALSVHLTAPSSTRAIDASRLRTGPRRDVRCPAGSIKLRPGRNLQVAIDANPEGTTFCFRSGTYRIKHVLLPKSRDVFVGEPGAVLKGSKRLSDWTRQGGYWVATGQRQENEVVLGVPCQVGIECNRPEGLFIDRKPLLQVTSLSSVRRGRFFFDYLNDTIYMANDPRGHRVEASVGDGAFRSTHHYAPGVVIKNLVIERFANPSRTGAIYTSISAGWVIVNNEIRLNHGAGISHFSGARIRNNHIHHNGQVGLGGYKVVNAVVARNEIARNAIGGFAGWEAGGAKYVWTRGLQLRGNYVHHNRHHGLWTDTENRRTVFAGNRIVGNKGSGIFHEASYDAIMRNNVIARNGADGIFISSSSGVEAYGNTLAGNRGWGIHLFIDGARGYDLADNFIHENVIKMRDETYNGISTVNTVDPTVYSISKNNRFRRNAYLVRRLSAPYWFWEETLRTWKQWRAAGQDRNGTLRKR